MMARIAAGRAALVLLFAAGAPTAAQAALASCNVSATGVAFGVYDPIAATPNDSTGTVTVSCSLVLGISLLVAYSISLSSGNSGSYAARRMSSGSDQMTYNLYTPAGYGTVWGDGSGGSQQLFDSYLLGLGGATTPYTVRGRIPAQQNVRGGAYQDSIVVTVTY